MYTLVRLLLSVWSEPGHQQQTLHSVRSRLKFSAVLSTAWSNVFDNVGLPASDDTARHCRHKGIERMCEDGAIAERAGSCVDLNQYTTLALSCHILATEDFFPVK